VVDDVEWIRDRKVDVISKWSMDFISVQCFSMFYIPTITKITMMKCTARRTSRGVRRSAQPRVSCDLRNRIDCF